MDIDPKGYRWFLLLVSRGALTYLIEKYVKPHISEKQKKYLDLFLYFLALFVDVQ
jgi:hypothetical protein